MSRVPFIHQHTLRLVALEQGRGGCPDHVGGGGARKEGDDRLVDAVNIALLALPAAARHEVALEDSLQAAHGVLTLRLPGGRNFDDLSAFIGVDGEQKGFDVRLQLVLSALAGEDDHKTEPFFMQDGVHYCPRHLDLVTAEDDLTADPAEIHDIVQHAGENILPFLVATGC